MPKSRRSPRPSFLVLTWAALALLAGEARAQEPVVMLEARTEPRAVAVGQRVKLVVELGIPAGFHLWSFDPGPGPLPLTLTLPAGGPLSFEGPWYGDEPVRRFDRGFERELLLWEVPRVHLERVVRVDREIGGDVLLQLRGQICTEKNCMAQRQEAKIQVDFLPGVEAGEAAPALAGTQLTKGGQVGAPPAEAVRAAAKEEPRAQAVVKPAEPKASGAQGGATSPGEGGILEFLLLAFGAGIAALATPCVFPAIPLTVSFFSKYSAESFGRGARLATVYALTMVATFTGAGMLVSILFGATSVQKFAAHPLFNFGLGATLVFFALNLLGLFEIRVPGFVLTFVNRLESRYGRTATLGAPPARGGLADYGIVAVAAVTATTVFFTCTAAFVGAVFARAALGEWFWPTIGMAAFSSAFALPFFLLAVFPQAAQRLRGKGGNWLSATRVTLGFFELAASTKFLSNADIQWSWSLLSRDVVLALWVPLFVLCGLYLLGKLHFGDEPAPEPGASKVSVLRVLAAAAIFGLALHLAAGLLNRRPFGGWLDGWLPPLPEGAVAETRGGGPPAASRLEFIHDLVAGRATARAEERLVFVNYTGYTCTNCRYMEVGVFPLPQVASLLEPMVRVELYTDGGREEHDRNAQDQLSRFHTTALPFYSVECADGTVLGTFANSTNEAGEFAAFLRDATKAKGRCSAPPPPTKRALVLKTRRLTDGEETAAIVSGKWTLLNFWATWCAPCVAELKEFLAAKGRDLEARGGRFALVAVEEDSGLSGAQALMKELAVPSTSALRLPAEYGPDLVDPRFGLSGSLPFTALVSPEGEIVWRHSDRLTAEELEGKLACFLDNSQEGLTLALRTEKCGGADHR